MGYYAITLQQFLSLKALLAFVIALMILILREFLEFS